ncbi:MAG: MFS transporter [Acidobacteriota bacterium]|nr:MFS transporter [Acidobacteriota bacterium]
MRPAATETPRLLQTAIRKASLRLIPLLGLGYGIAYIDRVNISFAALQMNRDLRFSATVYGFGAGLFFLSYAACEIPSNLLLCRFGARRWLARIMITWGLIALCMTLVRTPWQFYTLRFMLGMAEAGFFPGVVFFLTQWFPPALRGRTFTAFYVALPLSVAVMGALAGSLLGLNGRLSLAGWQWLFLVEAAPAILLGIVYLLYLPDSPAHARWLSVAERSALLAELNQHAVRPAPHEPIAPALRDPRVWLLGAFMFCMLTSSYGYIFSAPIILQKATGYTNARVGYLLSASGILGAFLMLAGGILADRTRSVRWIIVPSFVNAVGLLALARAATPTAAILSLLVVSGSFYLMQGPVWSLGTTFLTGRSAAAGIALMNTLGILGGFIGPYFMGYARDLTGNYQRGLLLDALPMILAPLLILCLKRLPHPAGAALPLDSSMEPSTP